MITTALVVKVLRTEAHNGDRATRTVPAWTVMVSNGDEAFFPVSGFSCFATQYIFDEKEAMFWARNVADILGGVPISLFQRNPQGVEVFVGDFE